MTNINFLSNLVVKNEVNYVLAAEKNEVNCAPADAKRLQIAGGGASRHEALIIAEQFSQSCVLRSEGAQKERSGRTMYKAQKENAHGAELFGYHGAFIPDGHPTADRQSCMTPVGDQRGVKRQNDHELPLTYPLFAPYLPLTYTPFDSRSSVSRQSDVATRVWKYAACVVMLLAMSIGQMWATDFTVTLDQFRTKPISGLVKIDNSNLSVSSGALQLSSGNKDFTVSTTNSDYKIKKIVFTCDKAVIKYSGDAISDKTFQPATPGTSFTLNLTASGGTAKITQMVVTLTTATSETLESLVATALSDNTYTTSSSVITITTVGGSHTSTSGQEQIKLDKSKSERSLTISTPVGKNLKFIAFNYYDAIFSKAITASTGTYTAATYTWTPGETPTNTVTLTFNTENSEGAKIRRIFVGYEAAGGGCGSTAQAALTLSSSSGTICGTGTATFTVSGGSGTGALSVSSSAPSKATASIDGTTVTVTGVAAGSATITVTKACDATYAEKTATYSATVAAVPTANAGADKVTEPGEGVALDATAAESGCTGAWTIVSGPNTATSQLSSTSSATATFTPTVAGTYTLRWTITNTSSSCSAYDEMTVSAAVCSISECGNATLTYAINGGSSGDHSEGGADLISSATASNTTALGASTTVGYTGISMSSLAKKAAAAISACYPTKPNMSGKIGVYNGAAYNSSNYLQFAFTVKTGYTFTPCDIEFTVQPVDVATNFRWEVTDGTNVYGYGTATDVPKGSDGGASVLTGLTSTAEMAAGTYYIRLYPYVNAASKTFRISNNVILKGTTAEVTPTCVAPTSVTVEPTNTNGWRYSIGETIDLTCTAEGGTGTKTYQWQKYTGSAWTNISTATNASAGTARLQIASCTASDGGSYQCVVSTGAGCSLISNEYRVYVFTLDGNYYGGGDWVKHPIVWNGANTGTVTLSLTESSTFMYKVTNNDGKWYGGTSGNFLVLPVARDHYTDQSADIRLFTGPAGDYTFTIDITHFNDYPGTPYVNISVAYPIVSHPASGYAYFKKWNDWSGYYIHWWYNYGSDHPLSTWGSDPQVTTETTICGTDYIYFPVLDTYNKLIVKDAAGDASHKTGDISSVGSSGKYFDFTNDNAWNTFTTYTVSAVASTAGYGTVSVSSVSSVPCGTSISASTNTLSVGATNVTATPAAATAEYTYAFDNWAWTPAGATVTSDVTATATFTRTPKSYTLTWVTDGDALTGTYTSGSVAYGTTITQPDSPTKTGYNFSAWSPSVASTMPAENTTYTATWTAKTTTITINANTDNHGSTTPGTVTATYGSALPSFTTAVGVSGYSLTGYFTAATGGTKIINADGTLVASTDYADGSGKWKYETSTLTLYPQYEEEVDDCYSEVAKVTLTGKSSAPTCTGSYNPSGAVSSLQDGNATGYYKLGGKPSYVKLQLGGGNTFHAGDSIILEIRAGDLDPATGTGSQSSTPVRLFTNEGTTAFYTSSALTANTLHTVRIKVTADMISAGLSNTVYIYRTTDGASPRYSQNHQVKSIAVKHCIPSCSTPDAPISPTNGATTSNSQAVSWTDESSDKWDVYVSTSSTTPAGGVTPTASGLTAKTYTFTGLTASTAYYWWVRSVCDDTHKSDWVAGTSFTTIAAATLYTVTFESNGGSSVSPITQASEGASISMPANPTRTGFEFDGWYKTDGTKVNSPSYTPTADITLYARWQETCDAEGVAKSTTDVAATGYTAYQEKGGSNVVFTAAPSLEFKYKDAAGNTINNSTTAATRSNAYSCQIKSDSGNKGSIKTNSTFSDVDSISFYFAASDKGGCKIAVWCSTDNFSTDSTSLLSATTYGDSNKEFKQKTLAIPAAKKTSALTFKFRFTVTGAGKTCYMDSLKVYSSTSGGSTCYHVYYHGNGAESGFVSDTTSYSDGAKATVLSYNDSRYPFTKDGYDFQGWATTAEGIVAYSAGQKITIDGADVHLYAKWATASTALVTWKMRTADDEAWATTTGTGTTDGTNITSISTAHDEGDNKAKNSATAKTAMASGEVSSTAAPDKSARFTFTIAGGKQVEINKFDCKVFNVSSGNRTYKVQISDAAGNVYNSTNTVPVTTSATLTDASFVFGSGKILRGAVTIRIYAWKTSGSPTEFRMGPDVKFYGTVEDYECATPDAPTISGVSEYVPGQTITLTASHDGENYDNLTTYTWYKGDAWGSKSEVQAADTGESGYTLTIVNCTTGDAGHYWCEVANGTCNAHNSVEYSVIVYPTYTITYNLNEGAWGEVEHKDSYTRFDEDYTLPTPTKTGSVFAGWYETSDFTGLPTVVLGAGSVGNKEYYAKWGAVVTVSWTVTKVDDELYRGGGGYSVKAVIDQTGWSTGFKDELELTATEGVTLKNIVASVNDESKVQVTADFDITTDLAADATSITFTLNVPADGTYGPKVDEHEETLTSCAGSSTVWNFAYASDDRPTLTSSNASTEGNKNTLSATTGSGNLYYFAGSSDAFETDKYLKMNGYSGGGSVNSRSVYQTRCFYIDITSNGTLTIQQYADNGNGAPKYVVANTRPLQSDYPSSSVAPTTTGGATYEINVTNYSSGTADRIWVAYPTAKAYIISVTWTPTGGGGTVTPTLTWETDLSSTVDKVTGDADFTHYVTQNKNSLGTITYSSSDETVATVNATTGKVHIVGAAGTATITATLAASGCFNKATAAYTISVVDNCIDVPGTIEWTDLGCDGILMTVSGHTAEAGVTYQWYKDDAVVSGATEITYTATAAGEYYVMVTNTGTDHCSMASTNTIKVTAKAAATATKIVDSWYVKKDRRTPDVELVKTTGATGFTVKIGSTVIWNSDGSNITGFAGCGFRMDENGIIYLNGTKDGASGTSDNADAPAHGDETWTAGDVTLTITAIGCGSSASQAITIHKQAATTYKEIAFVADGGKGMKKDSITVGHGDGTELYEYLDSVGTAAKNRLFKLSERNIYWTTDEKAIREEYSQFDAILITDDPSTNTVVKKEDDYKTKGYVNAFGTMVDVRPIFTMEAYVSALTNWGSKGIAGNPESPNPRQYEMRLECKDHEIYGAGLPDPEDGTNVWEEVIDGETFRHVILVDSTKGVYKGVAYNAETAGNKKPALQGFTGEAAGSLLGLGRILEGTLQAAIERQEEPAARLLVMGINAKALQPTCALTNEGKTVIKNILIYLLKTNMEEVDDCSNYFTGKTNSLWSEPSNWSKTQLPSSEAKVRILAPCVISGIQPHVLQVSIVNSGNSNIRNTARGSAVCDGTLTIQPDGALIADGKIRSAVAPHFTANDLMPTTPEMLTINTNGSGQAALIFNNEEGLTKATVNLHSLGRNDGSYKYQYFAIPMEYVSVSPAFANETHGGTKIYTYVYNEASSGWTRRGYYDDLYAFEGLGITTKSTVAMNYTMTGTLASTATKEITLTHDDAGLNLIGNSWMAPIQIGALAEDNTDANITKTVYIYSAGRDIVEGAATSGVTETAGQWLAVPFEAAEFETWKATGKLSVIPAMQAFQIKTAAEATLTLDYDKVVRGSTNDLNAKLRAPRRREDAQEDEVTLSILRVADSKTHTDISLFEGGRFSDEFDNGWEAEYINSDGRSAQFYARGVNGKMAVLATNELEGTKVGFEPGREREYTIRVMGSGISYYLNDLKERKSMLISEGNTYSFTYDEGDEANRFLISGTPFEAPQTPTGIGQVPSDQVQGTKVQKVIYQDKVYIIRGGKIYDIVGKVVK